MTSAPTSTTWTTKREMGRAEWDEVKATGAFSSRLASLAAAVTAAMTVAAVPAPAAISLPLPLNDPHVDRRIAAALVLGRIDGLVLTRRLIEMVAADQNRREAFIALASSRGAEARAFVRQAAQSEPLAGLARSTLALIELQQSEVP